MARGEEQVGGGHGRVETGKIAHNDPWRGETGNGAMMVA